MSLAAPLKESQRQATTGLEKGFFDNSFWQGANLDMVRLGS